MIATATSYLNAGLCVLPANREEKRPALPSWKIYQARLPTELQVSTWFASDKPVCVLTGSISSNLEMIDFDNGGELFDRWCELVFEEAPDLFGRLVIERSQSGGRHVVYRCTEPVPGNRKLAERDIETPSGDTIYIGNKPFVPRACGDRFHVTLTLIETRGEGGLFLCAPTPGYELEQGSFENIPVLTVDEHEVLIASARALNEVIPLPAVRMPSYDLTDRPGDDFNQRGDVREVLVRHGWSLVRAGENEHWRRPGKESGCSATLKNNVFYVFSSNAAPFEPEKAYAPFSVYSLLEHNGDFATAASALRSEGYGGDDLGVDLSGLICNGHAHVPSSPPTNTDPGPLPDEMYRVPGFVSEVMDHCLETAPYPNVPLAFCGALALQAVLAGRKVRDEGNNRTNIYLLALAHSAAGKDWPRKVNMQILHDVGLIDCLGERFASGEGIQDALFRNPSMLFQTDEIDGLLTSINKSKDARHESIMGTLLTMYSSANGVYPMRQKAAKKSPGVIDQPNLVVLGTAIPNHYYASLSERMLTNGLFARMIIVEVGKRGEGQEPQVRDTPERIVDTANWWGDFKPGNRRGNLLNIHPVPAVVPQSEGARRLLANVRQEADAEYRKAEAASDPVGTTVWGRVSEQTRKLALLYAVSENHENPLIDVAAIEWASTFVAHGTKRMLFMAQGHVADNPFHADCLKVLRKLREAEGHELPHSVLLKRMKMDSKGFMALIDTLCQQREIEIVTTQRAGSALRAYRLVG